MFNAVNNSRKQRGRPFKTGVSGNPSGRPRGSRNKRSLASIEAAQASGQMPLDYMLGVMRDRKAATRRRDEMAKAAAPYLHSKIASIEHSGSQDKPVTTGIEVCFCHSKTQGGLKALRFRLPTNSPQLFATYSPHAPTAGGKTRSTSIWPTSRWGNTATRENYDGASFSGMDPSFC